MAELFVLEAEPGAPHDVLQAGQRFQEGRIDRKVGIGGVRLVVRQCLRADIHRLGAHQDDRLTVVGQSLEGVEEDPAGCDVFGVGEERGYGLNGSGDAAKSLARHRSSWLRIHSTRASPSAGMRPLPVRQSAAV